MKKKRQLEIDIVKGLAILFMFLVHCNENYSTHAIQNHGFFSHLVFFLGGPLSAPVFMFCMGVGMVYTSRQTSRQFIKRGLCLFLIGYGLNFFRDFIPYTIQSYIHHDPAIFEEAKNYLVCTDILPFAGLAYLFMGLFKWTSLKDKWLVVLYTVFALLNVILLPIKIETRALACVTGLLWGSWDCTWFPFLSWIGFPIAGYLFGKQLIKAKDTDAFYKKTLTWTALLFLPLFIAMYALNRNCNSIEGYLGLKYFHLDWFGNMMVLEIVVLWVGFWHFASENLPSLLKNALIQLSKELNLLYIVQWLLIGYGNLAFGYYTHSIPVVLLLYVFTLIACHLIVAGINPIVSAKKLSN